LSLKFNKIMENFKNINENIKNPGRFLNDWDKKYIEKGLSGVIPKIYEDFGNNFPEVILLPEKGARPLYYLLNPIFIKLNQTKNTRIPKFIYFSVSKKVGANLRVFAEPIGGKQKNIKTSDELFELVRGSYPELSVDVLKRIIEKEKVEEVMIARDNMQERAEEIKQKIPKENIKIAIFDEVLANGETIQAIRKAFNNEDIPAYTIIEMPGSYTPLVKSGYRMNDDLDPDNPLTKGYTFSFEFETDAIGVSKSIDDKYSLPIKKENNNENHELSQDKKQLRKEMKNLGEEISNKLKF